MNAQYPPTAPDQAQQHLSLSSVGSGRTYLIPGGRYENELDHETEGGVREIEIQH
jgi:hypothetical protein